MIPTGRWLRSVLARMARLLGVETGFRAKTIPDLLDERELLEQLRYGRD